MLASILTTLAPYFDNDERMRMLQQFRISTHSISTYQSETNSERSSRSNRSIRSTNRSTIGAIEEAPKPGEEGQWLGLQVFGSVEKKATRCGFLSLVFFWLTFLVCWLMSTPEWAKFTAEQKLTESPDSIHLAHCPVRQGRYTRTAWKPAYDRQEDPQGFHLMRLPSLGLWMKPRRPRHTERRGWLELRQRMKPSFKRSSKRLTFETLGAARA